MPPGEEKFVGIAELKGWGYSNSDVRGYINALSILQVYIVIVYACVCELKKLEVSNIHSDLMIVNFLDAGLLP
jgi:hypothetical protein